MKIATWGHPSMEFSAGKDGPDDIKRAFDQWAASGIEKSFLFSGHRAIQQRG